MNLFRWTASAGFAGLALAGCAATPPGAPTLDSLEARADAVSQILAVVDRRYDEGDLLSRFLGHPDPEIRRWSARAAGQMGADAHREDLLVLISDPDTAVAATAAYALGRLTPDPGTIARLRSALGSDAPRASVGREAAFSLGRIGGDEAAGGVDEWLAAADRRDPAARAVGPAVLLAAWRFERPLDPGLVRPWLDDPDPELRWRALYSLVRRPVPAAGEKVLRRMTDPDARVRSLAARFLASAVVDEAGLDRAEVVRHLAALAEDGDALVRVHALRSLAGFSEVPTEVLTAGLRDPQPHVRLTAAEALARRGGRAAVPVLLGIAEDRDEREEVRRVALEGTARLDSAAVRPTVDRWRRSLEWRQRAAAVRTAVVAGLHGVPEDGLRDPDGRVVTAAVRGLLADPEAHRNLLRGATAGLLSAEEPELRRLAAEVIAALGDTELVGELPALFERARSERDSRGMLAVLDAAATASNAGVPGAGAVLDLDPPADALVVGRAVERFGDAARSRWRRPGPVDTGRSSDWYRSVAARAVGVGEAGPVRAVLETRGGAVVLELSPAMAPLTVARLVELAQAGYFDDQEWPRVVPAFVAQGGDPRGDTSGGPGYTLRDEINRLRYERGTIGMAHSGPDTAGSQFFVAFLPQPHLDGDYTVVGRAVDGIAVLERILPGDRIDTLRILDGW